MHSISEKETTTRLHELITTNALNWPSLYSDVFTFKEFTTHGTTMEYTYLYLLPPYHSHETVSASYNPVEEFLMSDGSTLYLST
jgi:hypothetical protein